MRRLFKNLNWLLIIIVVAVGVNGFFYVKPMPALLVHSILILILIVLTFSTHFHTPQTNTGADLEKYRLETVVNNLKDGVIMYDTAFKILVFNRAAESILDVQASEVLGISFTKKLRGGLSDHFQPLLTILFPALAPTIVRHSELGVYPQIVDISFTQPSLELRVFTDRIRDEEGNVLGFIKVIHDRTREILLLRSKSQFITVASHQLRTPLTALNWTLESLTQEPLSEQQKELIAHATGSVNRMMKVANDLLDVAKIEEGRFGYNFQTINIIPFLEDALGQAQDIANQYGVKLYLEKPDTSTLEVMADIQKLGMVISNLLDNAIKYNIKNGQITVRIKKIPEQSFVQFDIEDTGIGIPPDSTKKIFGKFFRAENASQISVEGTGLGLYIARNIVRQHGGKMWLTSQLNRGSTFSFTLPTNAAHLPAKEFIYEE
jgi:signal transduction histidine kinase